MNAAASTSLSSGGAAHHEPASACSASPPSDWGVMPTTRRPTHSSAPGPAASTVPQTSMPRVNGGWAMTAATPPRQRAMSPKLSEAALTATRTWPAPGSGASTSCTSTTAAGSPLADHPGCSHSFGTTWERREPIRAAAALPASRTSSWLSGSLLMPAARLVTRLMPEDLHAGLAGGDRLEGGAHADQLAAEDAGHPHLGRGLVVRPGELHVDALVEARVHLAAERAQPGAVEVGQVDEGGARRSASGR